MRKLSSLLGGLLISLALAAGARGQWPNTVDEQLEIAFGPGNSHNDIREDVCPYPDGNTLVVWDHWYGTDTTYVEYQIIDPFGYFLFQQPQVLYSINDINWLYKVISDGEGGAVILFKKSIEYVEETILLQRLDGYGNKLWGDSGIVVATELDVNIMAFDLVRDPNSGDYFVFYQIYALNGDALIQKFNPDGNPLWPDNGCIISDTLTDNSPLCKNNLIAPDLNGGVYGIWRFTDNISEYSVYIQHLDQQGNRLWGSPEMGLLLNANATIYQYPEIVSDGVGGAVLYDQSYFRRISPSGTIIWSYDPNNTSHHNAFITPGDSNDFYFTWNSAAYEGYLRGNRFHLNGNQLWPGDYLQFSNHICDTDIEEYGVFYQNGYLFLACPYQNRHNILSQKVSSDGILEWVDGIWTTNTPYLTLMNRRANCTDQQDGLITVFRNEQWPNLYGKRVLSDGSLGGNLPRITDLTIELLSSSVILRWSTILNADIYNLYISSQPSIFPTEPFATTLDTFYVDTTGFNQEARFYQVTWER